MRFARVAGAVLLAVASSGLLAGCEVVKEFGATCTTSPPVPHQEFGVVQVDVEVPPRVAASSTFAIRVDWMIGYPYLAGPGSFPSGVLEMRGPVNPSGPFGVGQTPFGGSPFPVRREFTATGQPSEEIVLMAVSGSSIIGTFPDGFGATCSTGGAEVVAIPIVEP